jgi:hypothetical protein
LTMQAAPTLPTCHVCGHMLNACVWSEDYKFTIIHCKNIQ